MPGSFYGDRGSSAPCAVTCLTCNGTGIVWEPEKLEAVEAVTIPATSGISSSMSLEEYKEKIASGEISFT